MKRLLFLGSSCIYPRECLQLLKEEYILTGPLKSTNFPYAIAKISGVKICEDYNRQSGTNFVILMPTNLYGANDNFDLETSRVLPALIRKFHEAKKGIGCQGSGGSGKSIKQKRPSVVIWGTGKPRREFLHVDDLADACLFLMNLPDDQFKKLLFSPTNRLSNNSMPHATDKHRLG